MDSRHRLVLAHTIVRPFTTKWFVLLTLPGLVGLGQVVMGCVALLVRLGVETKTLDSGHKFGYCQSNFSGNVTTKDQRISVENEEAVFENIDVARTILVGALMLLNICFVCAPKPEGTNVMVQPPLEPRRRRTKADTRTRVSHRCTWCHLGAIAVLHFALDMCVLFKMKHCVMNFSYGFTAFVLVRLAYGVGFALTQGGFQCKLMDDMSNCNTTISHLKEEWTTVCYNRRSYAEYHHFLMARREYVKKMADHWFVPLSVNIMIHGVMVGICAAQIVLRIFFFNSRNYHNSIPVHLQEGRFDDPPGVFWYSSLGIIYTLQLCVFLPQLCSINTHADELVELVMEELEPYAGLQLSDLKNLAEVCPVSFPVMCFRLSKAKVSSALAAAMVSLIGLGVSVGKQHLTQCTCK